MSILESVYKAFSNLDRDFARSKKSRSDFIKDKFGGDINTGAIIILDAIREEGVPETPEDIDKLSFIKDSFAFFQENAARLDKLDTFFMASSDLLYELAALLSKSEGHGTNQTPVVQSELWNSDNPSLHYLATKDGTVYTPFDACKVYCIYNENMAGMMQSQFGVQVSQVGIGDKFRVTPSGALRQIQDAAISRSVK